MLKTYMKMSQLNSPVFDGNYIMSEKCSVFVFGNGSSRHTEMLDVDSFKRLGPTIGCNAIYRDYSPDILVSADPGMIAEIATSEYPINNRCYFRDWNSFPLEHKGTFLQCLEHLDTTIVDVTKGYTDFVVTGHDDYDISPDDGRESITYFIGTNPSLQIKDVRVFGCDKITPTSSQKETYEFTGPLAVDIATKFGDIIYLLGFDFIGKQNGSINNVYAGTDNYSAVDAAENVKLPNAIIELLDVIKRNPRYQFVRVGDKPNPTICSYFAPYENFQFVSYLDFFTLHLKEDSLQYRYRRTK